MPTSPEMPSERPTSVLRVRGASCPQANGRLGTEPQFIAGMSAYVSEEQHELRRKAGMDELLCKPANKEKMLGLLHSRRSRRRAKVAASGPSSAMATSASPWAP